MGKYIDAALEMLKEGAGRRGSRASRHRAPPDSPKPAPKVEEPSIQFSKTPDKTPIAKSKPAGKPIDLENLSDKGLSRAVKGHGGTAGKLPPEIEWHGDKPVTKGTTPTSRAFGAGVFDDPAKKPSIVRAPSSFGAGILDPTPSATPPVPPVTPPVTPPVAPSGPEPGVFNDPIGFAKRNPYNALLGIAGAGAAGGAGLYGLYHMYANRKLKQEREKNKLNQATLKSAWLKLADVAAMGNPTVAGNAPSVPPSPAPAAPQAPPPAAPAPVSSMNKTTGQAPSQLLAPTKMQNAAEIIKNNQQQAQGQK